MPLLHDRRWARDMALDVTIRWSGFDSFGGQTVMQGGLRWQPSEEVTLRTNYGEVFRAPSLRELYEPPQWDNPGVALIRVEITRQPPSK